MSLGGSSDGGSNQVITILDTNDFSTASSFSATQAPPSILNPFPSSPTGFDNNQQISNTALLIGVISVITAATIILLRESKIIIILVFGRILHI
jgi:hypothetical protein